ncbi:MAG: AI-2E family transporter [Myxococcales bacterium]|nr:AI-2E family transporter [Myxococcales bacterium]
MAWFKRFAKLWGFALFCLFVVYFFRHIALPFVFAILVAYLLAPVVDRMCRVTLGGRQVSRGGAVALLYAVMLMILGAGVSFVIPRLSGDFARLFREAPALFERVNQEYLPRVGAWVDRNLGAGDEEPATISGRPPEPGTPPDDTFVEPMADGRYRLRLGELSSRLSFQIRKGEEEGTYLVAPYRPHEVDRVTGGRWERSIKRWLEEKVRGTEDETRRALEYGKKFVTATVNGLWKLTLVLMLAAFILIDLERVRGFIRSLVPESYRSDYDRIARGVDRGLSGVIRGQLTICVINGGLTYVGLLIFKVKYPLLLAGIATVMSLIPIFGSFLSSIPIVAIAIMSRGEFDVMLGVYVAGWIVFIHLIEANFLNPKILGTSARIHPVLVVFALVAGEHTYGLVGALFAVPVLSIVQTVFIYLRRQQGHEDEPDGDDGPFPGQPAPSGRLGAA